MSDPSSGALFRECEAAARAELASLAPRDLEIFVVRLERFWRDLLDGLRTPYGDREDFEDFVGKLARLLARRYAERSEDLKLLDLRRTSSPDWFQNEAMIGYVFYVDRFADDLEGAAKKLPYLEELGVNYVHLMPLLKTRDGANDGGYAVSDYRSVEPRLGTMKDLKSLCDLFRGRGVSVCLDVVLNHTAREHEWAEKARAGEPDFVEMYHTFEGRTRPDLFEETLPEVFPDTAPGNFTYEAEMGRWVWTTFSEYQWDLDWSNPRVFLEITDVLLSLANVGVEVFRLDAVAFMWKRLGTNCQNQPEVHYLLQALRACSRICAPAIVHKAEAIVSPGDLIHYLGTGSHHGKESDLAYNNSLMVQFFSALASRDTRLMTHTLREFPAKPANTAWATYIRGHDDVGWAITEEDAAAVGLDGAAHRAFLSDFYSGEFPGSHARGAVYQPNEATGDRRISGSLASLLGLEAALESGDERLVEMSVRRILLGHALIFGYGGVPLVYMGDEVGTLNDLSYLEKPDKSSDNRWMHRPRMDWEKASLRRDATTLEGQVFGGLRRLIEARKRTPHLHAAVQTNVLDPYHPRIFAFERPHPLGSLVAVHNFTEEKQRVHAGIYLHLGIEEPFDRISGSRLPAGETFELAPYRVFWISDGS